MIPKFDITWWVIGVVCGFIIEKFLDWLYKLYNERLRFSIFVDPYFGYCDDDNTLSVYTY